MSLENSRLNLREVIDLLIHERLKAVYTAIPAHVLSFNASEQMAQIELGVKRVDVNGQSVVPPMIIDVPILFLGDQFTIETQIDVGCEGLAIFSQRCVDGWITTGGCAERTLNRMFDMSDAFFIAGFKPIPKAIKGFSNNGVKIRNASGDHFVWLKNDGEIILKNSVGNVRILPNGTVNINGLTIYPSGNLNTSGTITINGIGLGSHVHGEVQRGNSNTGTPK